MSFDIKTVLLDLIDLYILAFVVLAIIGLLAKSHQVASGQKDKQPRAIDIALAQASAEQAKAVSATTPVGAEGLSSLSPEDPPLCSGTGLIYVSAPIDGVVSGGQISSSFLEYMAKLRQEFPQLSIIAPVVHDYALLPIMAQMSRGKPLGGSSCEALLQVCDEIWLIEYWGFTESAVVAAELAMAKRLGKTIRHFSPGSVIHLDVAVSA